MKKMKVIKIDYFVASIIFLFYTFFIWFILAWQRGRIVEWYSKSHELYSECHYQYFEMLILPMVILWGIVGIVLVLYPIIYIFHKQFLFPVRIKNPFYEAD